MLEEVHPGEDADEGRSLRTQRRFQFITISHPASTQDAATKRAVRKHVMSEVGRARRLPNRKRKPLTVSLVVPSQDELTKLAMPLNEVEVDVTSATDRHQGVEDKLHKPRAIYNFPYTEGGAGSSYKSPCLGETGAEIFSPYVRTEALIEQLFWLGAGPLDPFTKYPFEMGRSERALVAHIFHDPDGSQHAFRDAWYSVGLSDPAAFHVVLSNSAAHLNSARAVTGGSQSAEEIFHYDIALRSINGRIRSSRPEVSESIIGAVAGFICHSYVKGNYDQWKVHLKGINDMINLRGGIGTFNENKELRLTIMWVDLLGAYAQDIEPRFPFPLHLSHQRVQHGVPSDALQAKRLPLSEHCARLQIDLADLMRSVSCMDAEIKLYRSNRRPRHQYEYMPNGDWTNSIIHNLLTVRPMCNNHLDSPSQARITDEACRLGLLLFLAEIRRRCGVKPTRTAVLTEKLAAHLHKNSAAFEERESPLFLWLLMLGAMEAPRNHDAKGYFVQSLRSAMDRFHVEGREAVLRILRGVLWTEVHDRAAEAVQIAVDAMSA